MQINTNFIPRRPGVYLVGGTVRDMLMGREPTDYDIAATPPCLRLAEDIAAKAGSRVISLGRPDAAIYRVAARGGCTFDISPLHGAGIESDLRRRDFTINAMAIDLHENTLIDPLGGRIDIENRLIRMVGPDNLAADPLRMLRAFRLGAAFSFDLHEETKAAIAKASMRIQKTAGERIRDELIKLAAAKRSHPYILGMHHTGLLAAVLPELDALRHSPRGPLHHASAFDHTLQAFSELERGLRRPELFFPENPGFLETVLSGEDQTGPAFAFGPHGSKPARLKLALLLHDIGKPASLSSGENEGIHFRGHEARGAEMVRSISGRLRLSKNQQAYLEFMVKHHMNPLFLFTAHQRGQLGSRAVTRFFMKTGRLCPELCLHAIADSRGKPPSSESPAFEAFCRQLIQSYWLDFRARRQTPPLLTGRDLIRELGLSPSPLFATLLSRVETERLAGRLRTRADALAWVKNFLNSEKPS